MKKHMFLSLSAFGILGLISSVSLAMNDRIVDPFVQEGKHADAKRARPLTFQEHSTEVKKLVPRSLSAEFNKAAAAARKEARKAPPTRVSARLKNRKLPQKADHI